MAAYYNSSPSFIILPYRDYERASLKVGRCGIGLGYPAVYVPPSSPSEGLSGCQPMVKSNRQTKHVEVPFRSCPDAGSIPAVSTT